MSEPIHHTRVPTGIGERVLMMPGAPSPMPPRLGRIAVPFAIDDDGLLSVAANALTSGGPTTAPASPAR